MIMDITQLKQLLSSSPKTADALLPIKEYLTSLWASLDKSDEFLEALVECADASRDGTYLPTYLPRLWTA